MKMDIYFAILEEEKSARESIISLIVRRAGPQVEYRQVAMETEMDRLGEVKEG